MINIKPMQSKAYDCYQLVIATLANWYEIDFLPISFGTWFFGYNNAGKSIGDKIETKLTYDIEWTIECYLGIRIHCVEFNNTQDLEALFDYTRNDIPIILRSDMFWCPWSHVYKKTTTSISLSLLVTTKRLICLFALILI